MSNLASSTPSHWRTTIRAVLKTAGVCAAIGIGLVMTLDFAGTDYAFLAAYTILQYVALATAWNILGGYAGYVNFGVAAFYAVGVYTSVVIYKTLQWPLLFTIPLAALVAGLLGLGMGYLTLRLRGVFFSIATLALSVVLNTLIVNWSFVGGSRGVYIIHPATMPYFGSYARYLLIVMLLIAIGSVLVARYIEHSWIGNGLAALKDDELAAECAGVPSMKMKLIATTVSGALLGIVGAPFPYFVTYIDPASAFSLSVAVNAIAMPLIGGTATWIGPVIGALLLGTLQQVATVTISSALNLLLVGVLLVLFVSVAPNGIVGFVKNIWERKRK
ncbi:branched-chain amino acid ABC transporter permease [Tardiphaga sp. vice304]|uniref:branched-chain amino acid ABC transporter permease n=1 Tax=Tardiphaga sp. vice304 TaxID=2592817 RepID=UPI0011641902|nr:branched-chain amino acid ABC transporter permease [Tardiphaga sp. vice304]QDM25955.1 branched-chain amino acid ABC transporter permease [Tardiphaga sp. vice304]